MEAVTCPSSPSRLMRELTVWLSPYTNLLSDPLLTVLGFLDSWGSDGFRPAVMPLFGFQPLTKGAAVSPCSCTPKLLPVPSVLDSLSALSPACQAGIWRGGSSTCPTSLHQVGALASRRGSGAPKKAGSEKLQIIREGHQGRF